MDLASGALWGSFLAIVVANILLSGDNAVVIAMAARSLPEHQRKRAIWWGSAAAIVMRTVLTIVAVQLLRLPFLKLIGSLALLWIGVDLMGDDDGSDDVAAHGTFSGAVRTILVADLVMSVDNVIAVAGAADRAPEGFRIPLLILGLGLSIPLIIAGSTLLMRVMDRHPWIIVLGAALLGFLAGELMATDPSIAPWLEAHLPHAEWIFGGAFALLVVAIGKWRHHRRAQAPGAQPSP